MNQENTLIALWAGELNMAVDIISTLAINNITPESKRVIEKLLITLHANAKAIKEQLDRA